MIGIIGAGISGLSLAWELEKAGVKYVLFEKNDKPGGSIKTEKQNGYLLELGANSIMCDDSLLDFLRQLGLENQILPAKEVSKSRFILKKGKYEELPDSPAKLMTSSFFSLGTRLKFISEPMKSYQPKVNETIAEFTEARFGKEVLDYAVNPFVSGIYAGDPGKLLLKETFPFLIELMEKYGSVIKGLQKNPPARKTSLTFKDGMQILPEAIAAQLSNIRLSTEITEISKKDKGFEIKLKNDKKPVAVSKLILALPAYAASDLVKDIFPDFSHALKNIYYPPMVVTHSAFDDFIVKEPVNGFGALHPKAEERFTSGVLWTSSVFDDRAPKNEILFTCFTGGTQNASSASKDEPFIRNKVTSELGKLYHIKSDPKFYKQYKWEKSIPQYDENILPAKHLSDELESENVYVCNSWKNGVSIPDCIEKGRSLAKKFKN